jgi:hypothetical protein
MSRRNLAQSIESGLLTTNSLAKLTGMSVSHAQKICDSGKVFSVRLPFSRDRRIPITPELIDFLSRSGYRITTQLQDGVKAYLAKYAKSERVEESVFNVPKTPKSAASPNQPTGGSQESTSTDSGGTALPTTIPIQAVA